MPPHCWQFWEAGALSGGEGIRGGGGNARDWCGQVACRLRSALGTACFQAAPRGCSCGRRGRLQQRRRHHPPVHAIALSAGAAELSPRAWRRPSGSWLSVAHHTIPPPAPAFRPLSGLPKQQRGGTIVRLLESRLRVVDTRAQGTVLPIPHFCVIRIDRQRCGSHGQDGHGLVWRAECSQWIGRNLLTVAT